MVNNSHKLLKLQARHLLGKLWFSKSEIFEEYQCKQCNGQYILIDVVGIKPDIKIGVECGQLSASNPCDRFIAVKTCVDKIIWLPYLPLLGIGISHYKKLKDKKEWEKAIKLHEYFLETQGKKDPIVIKNLLSQLEVEKRKLKKGV